MYMSKAGSERAATKCACLVYIALIGIHTYIHTYIHIYGYTALLTNMHTYTHTYASMHACIVT